MHGYIDRGGSYAHSNDSDTSLSGSGSFDSYSSTDQTAPYDMVATPSPPPNDYFCPFERESFTSSPTPMFSSTINYQCFTTPMTYSMSKFDDSSLMYSEPSIINAVGNDQVTYELQYTTPMYSHFEDQKYINNTLPTFFGSTSPVVTGTSTSLPQHFVNPRQTFSEPFRPTSPQHAFEDFGNISTPPPTDEYSCQDGEPPYFISPVLSISQLAHSDTQITTTRSHSRASAVAVPAAMRRLQESSRANKRSKLASFGNGITRVAAGKFFCDFAECEKSKSHAFTRMEHLKRHHLTHTQPKSLNCPFCHKSFQLDRKDNWKAHIRIHAKPNAKGKRTRFDQKAKEMVEKWEKEKQEDGNEATSPTMEVLEGSTRRKANIATARR